MRLESKYYTDKTTLLEYPRPQLQRESYLNLNGVWQLVITDQKLCKTIYKGAVNVPFSPEALLSGIDEEIVVQPWQTLRYTLKFDIKKEFIKDITLLHFGAVDSSCIITLNGQLYEGRSGGYTPFEYDVTASVKAGANILTVDVCDLCGEDGAPRGKQRLKHGGIWYTPQSGIWQTVWLESVSADYVKAIEIVPNIDEDKLVLNIDSNAKKWVVEICDEDKKLLKLTTYEQKCEIDFKNYELWSPENPKLYTLKISTDGDEISSYFGMRKFGIGVDGDNIKRLMLNNKPYFHNGVLDQGYWSDGMLTPPSDEAMLGDILMLKKMGFNMIRKHIKIEPLRWYYYCDKIGMLVWQDFVNGGQEYKFSVIGALPFAGIMLDDTKKYKRFGRQQKASRELYIKTMYETINALRNCVSLAMWVLFNEGWGQFESAEIAKIVAKIDPTRTIDPTSGWHDQKTGDFVSLHTYFSKLKMPKDDRAYLLSEFGGYSYKVKGHVFSEEKNFGYKTFKNQEKFEQSYQKLWLNQLKPLVKKGLCASVYTQLSDVEEETNGLVTYDRKVVKIDENVIKKINEQIKY